MEANQFKPGHCYKVFFEKRKPIEFKFIKISEAGGIICEQRNGEQFDFNSLEQLLVIITVAVIYNFPKLNLLAGYAAKNTVSSVFIGQRILMLMPRF